MIAPSNPETLYRIATFSVPEGVLDDFLERAGAMPLMLRRQTGFLHAEVFQRVGGPGRIDVVSIAAWADQDAIDAAGRVIAAADAAAGFDRAAYLAGQGITTEAGIFRSI